MRIFIFNKPIISFYLFIYLFILFGMNETTICEWFFHNKWAYINEKKSYIKVRFYEKHITIKYLCGYSLHK